MNPLAGLRCLNHPLREAAARCPGCHRHFCRECVTDHQGLALCASCLQKFSKTTARKRRRVLPFLSRAFQLLLGLFTCWLFFYTLGKILLQFHSVIHEGTYWAGAPE